MKPPDQSSEPIKPRRAGRQMRSAGPANGPGWGGPAHGPDVHRPRLTPADRARGNATRSAIAADPHGEDALRVYRAVVDRARRAEMMMDRLAQIAFGGEIEANRLRAAESLLNRIDGLPIARSQQLGADGQPVAPPTLEALVHAAFALAPPVSRALNPPVVLEGKVDAPDPD